MSRNILKAMVAAFLFLSGCSLVRDQAYNLGYKDRRVLDIMKKQPLYSLQPGGIFLQKDHELILFDGDTLTMRYAHVVNGVDLNVAEYSVEVIEDLSALEGVYRLYGNGPLSGMYAGITLLTNNSGVFAKIKFQEALTGALDAARSQAEWGWVTDPLAFRSFKTFPTDTPVVYLSDPEATAGGASGVGGTNANTKQEGLRFIKLAHPSLLSHTNMIARVDSNGTPANLSDDIYSMEFNEVIPGLPRTNKMITYRVESVRVIAPNTEVYGVKVLDFNNTFPSSPVDIDGLGTPTVGSTGYLAVEFYHDGVRGKTISRMAHSAVEVQAIAGLQTLPFFRWESVLTADLPTRVIDRFNGDPVVGVSPFTSDDIIPGRGIDNMPLAYNAENTREFHFDVKNFTVRVLDVVNRITNSTTYRFRMIDDISTNEGVIQLQGTVGNLVDQYFHFRHYYPAAGEKNHGNKVGGVDTFTPGTDAPGGSRPASDTRLLVKIGQGVSESAARTAVNTAEDGAAGKIIYQSKTKTYKPHRLFVNMHKRGGTWVGVQDDGNYSTESATNWILNAISRTVQIRIATNTAPKFSTYRFHTVLDLGDNRQVAVLSNIPNVARATDMRDSFLEPDLDPLFANADNDATTPALAPFHGKYVALDLGTGVDNTRAKVEYADTLSEALTKLDNRTAWNLYESTAVPTPNRIVKTLAGNSPWIRLNADGYFSLTHTEKLTFDADDMKVLITWHRSASATTLDSNLVAAARYAIPLPLAADTSLQEGVFEMVDGGALAVQVEKPGGGFYPLPTSAEATNTAGVQVEAEDGGAYKYANAASKTFYSVLAGTLADANKARAGKGNTRDAADLARQALTKWSWHTLADAPLSPSVILHLMRTTLDNGNSPFITSDTSFTDASGVLTDFVYKPYGTYEYEFSNEPSLQFTVRRIQDTQISSAVFTLVVVNNLSGEETIARMNGSASLGNYTAGRFLRIRIPVGVDTAPSTPVGSRVYATNVSITVFNTLSDAETYKNPVSTVTMGQLPTVGDFRGRYNLRLKTRVAFDLNRVPLNKTYQLLIPEKKGAVESYDTYDIFNPKFIDSAYVQFTNTAAAGATPEYRIRIKDVGSLDYSTYTYEVMADNTAAPTNTLYVKLSGEGGLYHNRFAAFRYNGAYGSSPAKMHAVIGQNVFDTLSNQLAAQRASEATTGWRYRDLSVLTNKDYKTFNSLAMMNSTLAGVSADRIGSFVRVDESGVFRSKNTDIFKFEFPSATGGKHITNMQISITTKKLDGTESFGRYYFTPLSNTPANPAPNNGSSDPSLTTPVRIERGQIMYGYLISFNYGVDGSTALAPYNNHYVILRTDNTNDGAAGVDNVRSTIIAAHPSSLGVTGALPSGSADALSANGIYMKWWANGTTPRGGSIIPALAFNFRNQLSTDVNSRIIDYLAVNRWVMLSNIPAGNLEAGTARVAYAYDPSNSQVWAVDALTRQVTISNWNNGTPTVGTYDISMEESPDDFSGVFKLSTVSGNTAYDQRYVYAEVPGQTVVPPAVESAAVVERRTRDARIILGGTTIVGTATSPVDNSAIAVKAARDSMLYEAAAPAFGEWNAANAEYALNNPDPGTGISEKAFREFHRKGRYFYTYEGSTAAVNPTNGSSSVANQWNQTNWLAFMPLVRQRGSVDTGITNMLLMRNGIGGNYNFTNAIKLMQADAGRTVLQLAGANAAVTSPALNFTNLFMGVEYGSDVNDRRAKVVFSDSRAGALEALNLRTTYNYFDSEAATNSGTNEQTVSNVVVLGRGVEWVQVSNTAHNKTTDTPPGLPLPDPYSAAMPLSNNIGDTTDYDKIYFDPSATTNFELDPGAKIVREHRIIGAVTNTFVYGYTVIESSYVPSLTAVPTPRVDGRRYQFVMRLEGFGDYKNYFMAGEVGRFDASIADNVSDSKGASTAHAGKVEIERNKARVMFGTDVAKAKQALKYLQGNLPSPPYPNEGSWNFISKASLTKPSPLLRDSTDVTGYPKAPTTRKKGVSQRTGDPALITPAPNVDFYSRLATATGPQSNVLDVGNHTNFSFWYAGDDPFVVITSIRSNVPAQVRYKLTVNANFFESTDSKRRTNDVIVQLDNLGSPLHGKYIGLRRHERATPTTVVNDVLGDYFSMQIADTVAELYTAMGPAATAGTGAVLPITLRFSNDMARLATGTGDNPPASANLEPQGVVNLLTNADTGPYASLDGDGIYMTISNAQWNYNDVTKLMTITYTANGGSYLDPISGSNKTPNSAESYRVIPVKTTKAVVNGNGGGIALFRSDDTSGTPGFLHNKYVGIKYHGTPAGAATPTSSYLVYLTNGVTVKAVEDLLVTNDTVPAAAKYTSLTPYAGLDIAPLRYLESVRDPDNAANLPGVWALMNTTTGVKKYQFDPSNTTLYKADVDNRILYEEKITTALGGDGAYGAQTRTAVKYRINLVRAIPGGVAAGNANFPEQITFHAIAGTPLTGTSPITGEGLTGAATGITNKAVIVRIKKRVSGDSTAPPSWENISPETVYLGVAPVNTGNSDALGLVNLAANPDPFGVAAYVTSVSREALRYWGLFLGQDDFWHPTDAQGRVVTNSYDVAAPDPTKRLALTFDANTARNGSGYGDGDQINGVVHFNLGIYPNSSFSSRNRYNFWQRLIRQVDPDTLIFQVYGGQNHSSASYEDRTINGIQDTSNKLQKAVSNTYWIVRAGQGVELWRSRITNGATAAEALQNLGSLTAPNYSTDRGANINWHTYTNIPKGVDFIGNAEVNSAAATAFPPASAAATNALYSNRAPVALEVDNYTNWNFGSDTNNPSVTITIRSNVAGAVGEQTITYGLIHLYNPTHPDASGAPNISQAVFGLTGFGPFAGRVFSFRRKDTNQMRIVMAPAALTRAADSMKLNGTFNTNINFGFMFESMSPANENTHKLYTPKGYKDAAGNIFLVDTAAAIDTTNSGYWNFVRKVSLVVDAGILSKMDNADKRVVFKTGAFRATNTALVPQRVYDAEVTTNYSVELGTTPPTISIQPVGQSATTYSMGGSTAVETLTAHQVDGDTAKITTTAFVGAVRLGTTDNYLGIKILTTNGGAEGNAGIILTNITSTATTALQDAHAAVKANTTIPNHDYIGNVVTTSKALQDLEGAGTIISLNHYRGFDQRNSIEWTFNEAAGTVLATRLTGGAVDRSVVYKTILLKDFAKLSTDAAAPNDTGDLYAAILLKPTATGADPFANANRVFFIRRKANTNNTPLTQNDFKIVIGDATNAGLTALNDLTLFGGWTNTAKNLFTGGSVNGINYELPTTANPSPAIQAIPQTNFQLLSTLFGGHWSKLWDSSAAMDGLHYMYRKTDTTEYLFDNDRKLAIQRIVSGSTTNAYVFSVWLTNTNSTTASPVTGAGYTAKDKLADGDRGTFFMQAIGKLADVAMTPAGLPYANGKIADGAFDGGAPNTSGMTSKFGSFKFGHNGHITRAAGATALQQGQSLALTYAPDAVGPGNVPYRDLYDTIFFAENTDSIQAIQNRRAQEFQDPFFIPALQANASELLLVNAARQVQAQSIGTPVNEYWKFDAVSNMAPLNTGLGYHIEYDFNSGTGTSRGNSPGQSYNVNVNLNIAVPSSTLNAAKTNITLGFGNASGAVTYVSGTAERMKMLIRTIEANAAGTEGVVRFYYGKDLKIPEYLPGSGPVGAAKWMQATNQGSSTNMQLSNSYLAIQIGTGADMHTAKFVWGRTVAEAKANLAAQPFFNMAAYGLAASSTVDTMTNLITPLGAFVGPIVYGETDPYTIYVANQADADARIISIWKESEKPTSAAQFRMSQYQYKGVFSETAPAAGQTDDTDGTYFDVNPSGNLDGTRVGRLIGFGPLNGRLVRMRWTPDGNSHDGWALNTGTSGAGSQRYIRIARNAAELTNGWKNPATKAANATYKVGAAYLPLP